MDRRTLLLGGLSLPAVLSAQAQPSPTAPAVSESPSAWLTRNLEAIRARHRVPALAGAIVMNGRIAAEAATGFRKEGAGARVQVTDAFQLGSITKPMTATLTAIFVEKGMLRWDLTMESAFPELLGLMNSAYRKVTITQLLSHVSGMPYMPRTEPPDMFASDRNTPHARYAEVKTRLKDEPEAPPRTKVIYTGGSIIVAHILERLTNKLWEELIRIHVFEPLGMRTANTGDDNARVPAVVDRPWQHRLNGEKIIPVVPVGLGPPGFSRAHAPAGHANSSVGDLARFMIAHLPAASPQLLRPETLRFLQTPVLGDFCPGWEHGEASWTGGSFVHHNGTNMLNVADAYVLPGRNAAYCAAANVAGPAAWTALFEANSLARWTVLNGRFRDPVVFRAFGRKAPAEEITVEFWQKVNAVQEQSTFEMNIVSGQNRISAHVPWATGDVIWDFGDWEHGGRLQYRPPASLVGQWHHFALVASRRQSGMAIYRNAIEQARKQGSSHFVAGDYDLFVGWGINPFGGEVREFRVWDRARTQVEIQRDLNSVLNGSESGLLAYWRGESGSGGG